MDDTTRTALTGLGSSAIVGLGILPDLISVAVGIVTIIYLVVKIYKEIKT
tara:strand:- start:1159 stop:1308 length:150 start_codon:yes stop_codon:yes gene_type:complete